MTSMIALDKPTIAETQIIDIAFDFLLDGRSTSECRCYLLSEYNVDARDLGPLLERAQCEVQSFEREFNTRLKF